MYKLLIADDDEIILDGLASDIDWERHGIRVVGTGTNGIEALELVKERKPHILLSDIRMPFLDGLQLAEQALELLPHMKIVFLTAYEDFHSARKAIHLKATEFVLKYADKDDILRAVVRAGRELEEETKTRIDVAKSAAMLRNRLLGELLSTVINEDYVREQMRHLDIDLSGNSFIVAVADIEDYSRFSRETHGAEQELAVQAVLNIANELLFTYGKGYAFSGSTPQVNILFGFDDRFDDIEIVYGMLEDILEKVKAFLKIDLRIGIGGSKRGLANIRRSYREALHALDWKGLGRNGIVPFDSAEQNENSQLAVFRKIVRFVNDNYNRNVSLNEIAGEVNVSHTYICTLFRKHKNCTFSEYVIRLRMEKAKELLRSTKLKTYEVSERVGYPNPQYFSILFKKWTGLSPTEFKHAHGDPSL